MVRHPFRKRTLPPKGVLGVRAPPAPPTCWATVQLMCIFSQTQNPLPAAIRSWRGNRSMGGMPRHAAQADRGRDFLFDQPPNAPQNSRVTAYFNETHNQANTQSENIQVIDSCPSAIERKHILSTPQQREGDGLTRRPLRGFPVSDTRPALSRGMLRLMPQ